MSRVFVIADLHLGHKLIAGLRGFPSPIEHDTAIVHAWNSTVTKRDVVYVLGDVFSLELVPTLNGTKKLALGNHDQKPIRHYADVFSQVRGCFEYDNCLLTHIPISPCQFPRYDMNINGHKHAGWIDDIRYGVNA